MNTQYYQEAKDFVTLQERRNVGNAQQIFSLKNKIYNEKEEVKMCSRCVREAYNKIKVYVNQCEQYFEQLKREAEKNTTEYVNISKSTNKKKKGE